MAAVGDDAVDGGAGSDTLLGGLDDDTITGGTGDDLIHGESSVYDVEVSRTVVDSGTGTQTDLGNSYLTGDGGTFTDGGGNTVNWTATNTAPASSDTYNGVSGTYLGGGAADPTITLDFDQPVAGLVLDLAVHWSDSTSVVEITINGEVVDLQEMINNGEAVFTGSGSVNGSGQFAISANQVAEIKFLTEIETISVENTTSFNSNYYVIVDFAVDDGVTVDVETAQFGEDIDPAIGGDDVIDGGAGNDSIDGGIGDDLFALSDGFGNDTLVGGEAGETNGDALDASALTSGVNLTATGDEAGTLANGGDTATFSEIENFELTDFDDTADFSAYGSGVEVDAGAGDDTITGGVGSDSIDGGAGADSLDGGSGDDTLLGGAGDDTIDGGTLDSSTQPNLIQNGNFEDTDPLTWVGQNGQNYQEFGSIPGWTPLGSSVEVQEGDHGTGNADGNQVAEIDSITGGIAQTVTVTEAGSYQFSVDAAERNGAADEGFDVYIDNVFIGSVTPSGPGLETFTFDIANLTVGDHDIELRVSGSNTGNTGTVVDNVSLVFVPTDDDSMDGGAGDDTFLVNDNFGSDTIIGGESDETDGDTLDLSGLSGPVTVSYTGAEAGTITDGTHTLSFSEIERLILTDYDDSVAGVSSSSPDFIDGGAGNDAINSGGGADTVLGGDGDDSINAYSGDDSIDGGAGNDSIQAEFGNDTVQGGEGDDTVNGFAGDDSIDGGIGNDSLIGENGNDTVLGGDGHDTLQGQGGADSLDGGDGDDSITGGQDNDTIIGGAGNDTIFGESQDDSIDGGSGLDVLRGGDGSDTLDGGADNDDLAGGSGDDIFVVSSGHDPITDFNTGNTGGIDDGDSTNNDFIDLSGHYDNLSELYADQADDGVLNQSNTTDTKGRSVDYADNAVLAGSLTFTGATANSGTFNEDNTGVFCFTTGTLIATPDGPRPIESLSEGDLVLTRDNGPKPLIWIGRRDIGARELLANDKLRPVWLHPELVGAETPLLVSRQHGMLIGMDGEERLIRAIHLARARGGKARIAKGCRQVSYMHLMLESHEILFANGAPSESFYPGDQAMGMLDAAARAEIAAIFPELDLDAFGPTARDFLTGKSAPRDARLLGAL